MHSLNDKQIVMLRLAERHLALPDKGEAGDDPRNDLALLIGLGLVEPHHVGFRITELGLQCLARLAAWRDESCPSLLAQVVEAVDSLSRAKDHVRVRRACSESTGSGCSALLDSEPPAVDWAVG